MLIIFIFLIDLLSYYLFKIIIALGIGYILSYDNKNEDKYTLSQYSSLSCFFTTSIVGVVILVQEFIYVNLLIGIVFLAINYYLVKVMEDFTLLDKYKLLFASINGLIIGLGYIFYSIVITLIFSYIINNFDIINQLLNNNKSSSSIDKVDTKGSSIKNDLELNSEDT